MIYSACANFGAKISCFGLLWGIRAQRIKKPFSVKRRVEVSCKSGFLLKPLSALSRVMRLLAHYGEVRGVFTDRAKTGIYALKSNLHLFLK